MKPDPSEFPVFDEARKDIYPRAENRPLAEHRRAIAIGSGKREDRMIAAIRHYRRSVERKVDAELLHGPVRVIVKDGKPV